MFMHHGAMMDKIFYPFPIHVHRTLAMLLKMFQATVVDEARKFTTQAGVTLVVQRDALGCCMNHDCADTNTTGLHQYSPLRFRESMQAAARDVILNTHLDRHAFATTPLHTQPLSDFSSHSHRLRLRCRHDVPHACFLAVTVGQTHRFKCCYRCPVCYPDSSLCMLDTCIEYTILFRDWNLCCKIKCLSSQCSFTTPFHSQTRILLSLYSFVPEPLFYITGFLSLVFKFPCIGILPR